MRTGWEHFGHGPHIGVRGYGATRAEAFEQAALGLTGVFADPGRITPRLWVPIRCRAGDDEQLLVAWLNEVVAAMSLRRMLFGRFQVRMRDHELQASAGGEETSPTGHPPPAVVRRAAATALRVAPTPDGGWLAQAVMEQ